MMMQVKGICSNTVLSGFNGTSNLQVSKDIPKETLKTQFPRLNLDFRREGVSLEIRDYLRKCSPAKSNSLMEDWCSILGESSNEDIVLGSAFMRDYLITFDGTLGKVTLS